MRLKERKGGKINIVHLRELSEGKEERGINFGEGGGTLCEKGHMSLRLGTY
jgi:hypothetical protein